MECLYKGRLESDQPLWMKQTLSGANVKESKGGENPKTSSPDLERRLALDDGQRLPIAAHPP